MPIKVMYNKTTFKNIFQYQMENLNNAKAEKEALTPESYLKWQRIRKK